MKRDENDNLLVKKAIFYLERRVTIHIKTRDNKIYNGLIFEVIGEDFLILNDRMLGEIPIYFSEIVNIEPYRNEGVEL